jgi:hypothetical protein
MDNLLYAVVYRLPNSPLIRMSGKTYATYDLADAKAKSISKEFRAICAVMGFERPLWAMEYEEGKPS